MNEKQRKERGKKMTSKTLALRRQLWPELDLDTLWDRTERVGYTTIPRTMPHILRIMDILSPKGKPVSQTYLSLWCRVFDESMITIQNPSELAFESGFSGQRALTTWNARMTQLVGMGFIDAKGGASGRFQYVLIYNPYIVIKRLNQTDKIPEIEYTALFARAQDIGATDLQ